MNPEIKAFLDEHYGHEEPANDERYHITISKMYALQDAGLIARRPVLTEIPIPELYGDGQSTAGVTMSNAISDACEQYDNDPCVRFDVDRGVFEFVVLGVIQKFFDEVNEEAASNMQKTSKLEGSHFAGMKTVMGRWGVPGQFKSDAGCATEPTPQLKAERAGKD